MLDESILNLQITILLIIGTIIFISIAIRRKDLIIYLPPYIILPVAYLFIYLQVFIYSYRLIGNGLFLIAIIILSFTIYYEYFQKKKNYKKIARNYLLFIISPLTWGVIGIQIISMVIVLISFIFLIRLFNEEKNAKYGSLLFFLILQILSGISTILSNFNFPGAWEFSFLTEIIFAGSYLMFPLFILIEEKIIEVKTKLIESEEKYQLISENANDLIALLNNNYEHEYINEHAYFETLGYDKKDLIGRWVWDLVHPDDVKRIINSRGISTESFQEVEGTDKQELRIRHKDGHYIWIDYTSKVFLDNLGDAKVIVISRDITERKKAEELIREENKRLLELDILRRDLITRISHELRTPLTTMYGVSQVLLKADKNNKIEKIYPYIESSFRQSIRLKELIENLIDTSRVDNNKLELRLRNENISRIITNCVKELQYLAQNREQNFDVTVPDNIFLDVDKTRFEQVLVNILSNAIKNTPKKGKIFVYLNDVEKFIEIVIKDTGVGITEEEKKLLFQKFGKIERYGMNLDVDIEGVGLGLFISKEIIELHGGNILIYSEGRNKGTTATIRLMKKRMVDYS